jgi:hypothetical protein
MAAGMTNLTYTDLDCWVAHRAHTGGSPQRMGDLEASCPRTPRVDRVGPCGSCMPSLISIC